MVWNYKNIITCLRSPNIPLEEKEEILSKNKKSLLKLFKKLTSEEIINYFMDEYIPICLKSEIAKYIDSLYLKIDRESISKLDNINNRFINIGFFKKEDLYKKYYPIEFKKLIINELYSNIFEILSDNTIPLELKKSIIDSEKNGNIIVDLLIYDVNEDVTDYVINENAFSVGEIKILLLNEKIKDSVKDKIILRKINKDNICSVMNIFCFDDRIKSKILKQKNQDILSYVKEIKNRELLKNIDYYETPPEIIDKIFDNRNKDIESRVKRLNINTLSYEIAHVNNQRLADVLINTNSFKTKLAIGIMEYNILMRTLNNEYVALWVKDYIINNKKEKLTSAIKKLTYNEIEYYCLKSNKLPIKVQKEIFKIRKEEIIDGIKNIKDYYLASYICNKNYNMIFKEMILSIRINENNIFDIIKKSIMHKDAIPYILNKKRHTISNYLMKLEIEELVTLNCLKDIYSSIKNIIIKNNYELIKNKLKDIDKNKLYYYLEKDDVLFSIKKIILDVIGINKEDKDNYATFIKYNDVKYILNNYEKIKSFIQNSGIDFSSFVKYGVGTDNYSNWISSLNNIIDNHMEEDFIRIKKYLDENLYDTINTENQVRIIVNFLQIIDNFYTNYELLDKLEKESKILNFEDKSNLLYLFQLKIREKDCFKSLENVQEYRIKMSNSFINDYYNLSLKEIKNYINKYVLCDAKVILSNIGGTSALKLLKKQNQDSKNFTKLIDELLYYSKITEFINNSDDISDLRNILNVLFKDNMKLLIHLQNLFSKLQTKVLYVFELDSKLNLTNIKEAKKNESLIDKELSRKYGGVVLNLSDKNYCLYAHVLSELEDIGDLIKGKSNGNSIFISVSPISYLGQRYYYNSNEMIFAYDNILNGSFICSSIKNMGSNGIIKKNSYEVKNSDRIQRGILESSSVKDNNAESLLYREGLIPCGIILPGSKKPTMLEQKYHEKYNLPFIITQPVKEPINNAKFIFKMNKIDINDKTDTEELIKFYELLNKNIKINKTSKEYTGRQIAIITDLHAMYEPTLKVLESIRENNIDEIYSLGDNIGLGPNPGEVIDLLDEYNVKSVAGNSEYYSTLGIESFIYFDDKKIENQMWTFEKLGNERIKRLSLYPASIDINLGNKKIALCHFANDVRWDYLENSTWNYQSGFNPGESGKQFLYTNSTSANKKIDNCIKNSENIKNIRGYLSAKKEPLFNGRNIEYYDDIIQGHVHFDMYEKINNTNIHTLRALAMGFSNEKSNTACYYVLKERKDGTFDIEKRLVRYNKNILVSNILSSSIPHKEKVLKYIKA